MRRALKPAYALGALALASCSTTRPLEVWRDASYRPAPVHRIFVVRNTSGNEGPVARENAVALEIAIARALGSRGLEVVPPTAPLPPRPAQEEGRVVPAGEGVDLVLALRGRVDDPVDPLPYAYFTGDIRVYTAERYPEAPIWIGTVRTFTAYRDSYGPGSEMAPVPQPESVLQGVAAPLAASIVASLIQDRVLPL